jgi:transcriptional regulator with XRE-family HTH domain
MADKDARGRRIPPPQPLDERQRFGLRLAEARSVAGFTLDSAATQLSERGFQISRAALGHWETGKNLPDALWLRRIAKLYGSTVDALVSDESLTPEAVHFAVQYDALDEGMRRAFKAMWIAYVSQVKSDSDKEKIHRRTPAPAAEDAVLRGARPPTAKKRPRSARSLPTGRVR